MDLSDGDAVLVYTDGVTDALNVDGEEFGEARLIALCRSLPAGAVAPDICRLLSEEIAQWTAGVEQFDDTTTLVISVDRVQGPVSRSAPLEDHLMAAV